MKSFATGLLLFALAAMPLQASFPDPSPAAEMFDRASVVGYVHIESAVVQRIGGEKCGVVFQATVLEAFRGKPGASVEFVRGPSASAVEVGKNYLLFASWRESYDRRRDPRLSDMPVEFLNACKSDRRYLEPEILVGEDYVGGGGPAFVVPERVLVFPAELKLAGYPSLPGSFDVLEPAFLHHAGVLQYLRGLRVGEGGT